MVSKLESAMAYLCANYPHKGELSKARLTKMLYLADWRAALTSQRQITNLNWVFNHYGPYLDEVPEFARKSAHFRVLEERTVFGSLKEVIAMTSEPEGYMQELDAAEQAALDHVINKTKDLAWQPFIKLVYSTFPIVTQPRYQALDLVDLARQYEPSR